MMVIILCFILLFVAESNSNDLQLKHVIVLYRHGDRGPIHIYKNDRNKEDKWPNGIGQLTDIGIKQQFDLGKWLRIRYKTFLKSKYNYKEICVNSTNVDRTLMSAQSNLAGLYYNYKDSIIPGLNWMPVPIHFFPNNRGIDMLSFDCDLLIRIKEKMFKTKPFISEMKKFQRTLEALKIFSEMKDLTSDNIILLFDTFFCEKLHNMTVEPWVTDEMYRNMSQLNNLVWKLGYQSDELRRLSGGLMVNEIIKNLQEIVENINLNAKKLQMYSAHDTSLAALMSALGIFDNIQPPYASCLLIELLHKTTDRKEDELENYIIKVFYKTKSTDSPILLQEKKITECKSDPCTLKDFIEYSTPWTITLPEYKELCNLRKDN